MDVALIRRHESQSKIQGATACADG
ncbi:hypothetical protein F01_80036 [Burkholderia cenocepacia]|nr:hypothetical protein F01_80036 [Burkholderia cenocepacia]